MGVKISRDYYFLYVGNIFFLTFKYTNGILITNDTIRIDKVA
jgi:hypothetical protein